MKLTFSSKSILIGVFLCLSSLSGVNGQPVPGKDENIPFLVTFGRDGDTSWGDDDFSQTYFFAIAKEFKDRFYIRVFDPVTGSENDELKGPANTMMEYSIYGGKGVDPEKPGNEESRGIQPSGNYKSGTLLAKKTFGNEQLYYNRYYTFGPFIATQGDFSEKYQKYMFKIICQGMSGDDGNLYRYFLSRDPDKDVEIEGANAFTYEYTFRMWNDIHAVSHIYPYIDTGIIYVQVSNFDWDEDGAVLVCSKVRRGMEIKVSGQRDWAYTKFTIEDGEVGSSLDFQFHKNQAFLIRNNNVVISVANQRGDNLPFFAAPIGGVPVYQGRPAYKQVKK